MNTKDGARDYVGIRKGLLGQSLGELEAQIMDIIWDLQPPVTSAQVFKVMYPRRELSYSTIMLTMAKLSKKGFLSQKRKGDRKTDAFVYRSNISREEVGLRLMDDVCRKVLRQPLIEALPSVLGAKCPVEANDLRKLTKLVPDLGKK